MKKATQKWAASLPLTIGFAAVFLLVGGLGAWSLGVRIAGAVVATGVVQVETERQVVQHPEGGVVGEILARDGDPVEAGDVLVRLDGTFMASELALVEQQLLEIFARRVRLRAERDGAEVLDFGALPDFGLNDRTVIDEQIEGQRALFNARRASLVQEQRQMDQQQRQIERQIDGTQAQLSALERQMTLIESELENVQSLFNQGLVQAQRLLELQREEARLQGDIGRLLSSVAEAETRISELEIQSLRLIDTRREEAITRLRDLRYSEIELQEQRISLVERISRLEVRAPVSGLVFDSQVFAVQSVVRAAEPMLYIVPGDQPLNVSARIDPRDIEQVYPGQEVALMFTTFNQRNMPEITGTVRRVSADAETDPNTGGTYYEAIVVPDASDLADLTDVTLLPGMPVETFLQTTDRRPITYLTQPLTAYFNRAFRED